MAGSKETPRQRMIGMMYLVLTALLALNVSKEIVNAFVRLNDKIEDSNRILQSTIDQHYNQLSMAMAMKNTRAQAEKWNNKAMEIREAVEKEQQYLLSETNDLLRETEGQSSNWLEKDPKTGKTRLKKLMEVESKDDYDAATRIFVGGNPLDPNQRGKQLRQRLHALRDKVCNVLGTYDDLGRSYKFDAALTVNYDPADPRTFIGLKKALATVNPADSALIARIYRTLSYPSTLTEYEETTSWQGAMFDHAPVVAAAAILTSLRSDIKTAEALAAQHLSSKMNIEMIHVNKIEPVAFAPKAYLNMGDTMPLRVMIAAYDSNDVSKLRFSENPELSNATEQSGPISIKATSPGVKTIYGNIGVRERGEIVWKPWSFTYEVGQPTASISPTDLNILYAGSHENKITATASGYSPQDISLTGQGLSITRGGNGGYLVKVPVSHIGHTVKLSVIAKGKNIGSMDFRVKKVPKPDSYLGSISSTDNVVSKSQFIAGLNSGLRLGYGADVPIVFPFKVLSFEIEYSVGAAQGRPIVCSGTKISATDIDILSKLRPGASVTFRKIRGIGPSGAEWCNPIVLTIK